MEILKSDYEQASLAHRLGSAVVRECAKGVRPLADNAYRAAMWTLRTIDALASATESFPEIVQQTMDADNVVKVEDSPSESLLALCDSIFLIAAQKQAILRLPQPRGEEYDKLFMHAYTYEDKQVSTYVALEGDNGKEFYLHKALSEGAEAPFWITEHIPALTKSGTPTYVRNLYVISASGLLEGERNDGDEAVHYLLPPPDEQAIVSVLAHPRIQCIAVPIPEQGFIE